MRFILHVVIGFNNLLFVVCRQRYHILYIYHLKRPGMTSFKVTLDLGSQGQLVGGFTASTHGLQFFLEVFFLHHKWPHNDKRKSTLVQKKFEKMVAVRKERPEQSSLEEGKLIGKSVVMCILVYFGKGSCTSFPPKHIPSR